MLLEGLIAWKVSIVGSDNSPKLGLKVQARESFREKNHPNLQWKSQAAIMTHDCDDEADNDLLSFKETLRVVC